MITNTFIESSEARPGWTNPSLIREILRGLNLISPDGSIQITQSGEGVALQASAGGGGELVKITGAHPDSPTGASASYVFRGDVYGNGFGETATKGDVTIIPSLLADGEFDVLDFQTNSATRMTGYSWTDTNGNTVTETVYLIDLPIIL